MALNTNIRTFLVTADREVQSVQREESRISPGNLLWNMWHILRSGRGQRALAWLVALVLIVVDIALVGQHVLVRYQSYHAFAYDLGNFDQAVWNTLHGHPFRFLAYLVSVRSRIGVANPSGERFERKVVLAARLADSF